VAEEPLGAAGHSFFVHGDETMAIYDAAGKADTVGGLVPAHIAHNPALTAREKLDVLNRLRVEVTGALENGENPGVTPAQIDEAIAEIKLDAENGIGEPTILRETANGDD
jgi:hypothetical protein